MICSIYTVETVYNPNQPFSELYAKASVHLSTKDFSKTMQLCDLLAALLEDMFHVYISHAHNYFHAQKKSKYQLIILEEINNELFVNC